MIEENLAALPEDVRADLTAAIASVEERRTPTQKYLAEMFRETLKISNDELDMRFPELKTQIAGAQIDQRK